MANNLILAISFGFKLNRNLKYIKVKNFCFPLSRQSSQFQNQKQNL